jgi:c-di-GMP-binding flagellar brake protein YcgR
LDGGLTDRLARRGKMPKLVDRREVTRHLLPPIVGAEIEFDGPDGARHRMPLTEISVAGCAFYIPDRLPGVVRGASLTDAEIRVGQLLIQGNLVVARATHSDTEHICGVQFFPKTDADRNELTGLVSRLETLPKP